MYVNANFMHVPNQIPNIIFKCIRNKHITSFRVFLASVSGFPVLNCNFRYHKEAAEPVE